MIVSSELKSSAFFMFVMEYRADKYSLFNISFSNLMTVVAFSANPFEWASN